MSEEIFQYLLDQDICENDFIQKNIIVKSRINFLGVSSKKEIMIYLVGQEARLADSCWTLSSKYVSSLRMSKLLTIGDN